MSATELAKLIYERKVSPVELVEAFITRIELVNGKLNAVVRRPFNPTRRVTTKLNYFSRTVSKLIFLRFWDSLPEEQSYDSRLREQRPDSHRPGIWCNEAV